MLYCKQCKQTKHENEFHVAKNTKKGYQSICKICWKSNAKNRYQMNKEKHKAKVKEWTQNNIDKNRRYKTEWTRNKYQTDPTYRVHSNMSAMIFQALREIKNLRCWESLVDYTKEELMEHLENQFQPGMTWDNYGEWHIDHKIPRSSFNITSAECEEFKQCWALSNLQPLWQKDNLSKDNKIFNG